MSNNEVMKIWEVNAQNKIKNDGLKLLHSFSNSQYLNVKSNEYTLLNGVNIFHPLSSDYLFYVWKFENFPESLILSSNIIQIYSTLSGLDFMDSGEGSGLQMSDEYFWKQVGNDYYLYYTVGSMFFLYDPLIFSSITKDLFLTLKLKIQTNSKYYEVQHR